MYTHFFTLFALMAVGFAAKKKNLWTEKFHAGVNALVMKIAFPAMILQKISSLSMSGEEVKGFFTMIVMSVVISLISIFLCRGFLRIAKYDGNLPMELRISEATESSMSVPNAGFLGFPIATLFYGSLGLLYMISVNVWMQALLFGYAEILFMKKEKGILSHLKPVVMQPILWAVAVGLIMTAFNLHLPPFLDNLFGSLGSMSSPLAMIYVGSILASTGLKPYKREVPALIATVIAKLIVVPLIGLGLALAMFRLGIWDALVAEVFVVGWSLPTAALIAAFADAHGGNARLAGWHILLTTVVSMATIPLWVEWTARIFEGAVL